MNKQQFLNRLRYFSLVLNRKGLKKEAQEIWQSIQQTQDYEGDAPLQIDTCPICADNFVQLYCAGPSCGKTEGMVSRDQIQKFAGLYPGTTGAGLDQIPEEGEKHSLRSTGQAQHYTGLDFADSTFPDVENVSYKNFPDIFEPCSVCGNDKVQVKCRTCGDAKKVIPGIETGLVIRPGQHTRTQFEELYS